MYREQIKVLDCTIRDGGLINNHYFTDDFVKAVYKALSAASIDYMEMGYRSSRQLAPETEFGPWKYCDDEKITEITDGVESDVKLSIMVDAHRVKEQAFAPVDESPIDMIRIATYVKDIDKAIYLTKKVNPMAWITTSFGLTLLAKRERAVMLVQTSLSCRVIPTKVGTPVVPEEEWMRMMSCMGAAQWDPKGGFSSWLFLNSSFSVKGSLDKSSNPLMSPLSTPCPLNLFW